MKTSKKSVAAAKDSNVVPISPTAKSVSISAPDIRAAIFKLRGTAPLVQLRFSEKAKNAMLEKFTTDQTGAKKKVRNTRVLDDDFKQAQYISTDGWNGVHAGSFRAGMISACRLVDFKMTLAKLSCFIVADGYDKFDGTPLVRVDGKPERCEHAVRNANGSIDIRTRAMFKSWNIRLTVRYDAKQFSSTDVANLIQRVGMQVGIGEGRPDSKASTGMGWGTFEIVP